ncbi:hypothetical protein ACLOJK_025858 [Asimina triloba]
MRSFSYCFIRPNSCAPRIHPFKFHPSPSSILATKSKPLKHPLPSTKASVKISLSKTRKISKTENPQPASPETGDMTEEESPNANTLDEFYIALLSGQNLIPISDETFAVELHLQEAIFSSLVSSSSLRDPPPQTFVASSSKLQAEPPKSAALVVAGTGETPLDLCEICVEAKSPEEMFTNKGCSHAFCFDCIGKHVAAKIQENIASVRCPAVECGGVLEPERCRPFVPAQVLERWEAALTESVILGSHKFYCPFKDCSALLIDDGEESVKESECPNCRRLFCAQCKVPWHSGVGCEEYGALKEDEKVAEDLMVMQLAKSKGWRRCSRCRFYVERTEGCVHMVCRLHFGACSGGSDAGLSFATDAGRHGLMPMNHVKQDRETERSRLMVDDERSTNQEFGD